MVVLVRTSCRDILVSRCLTPTHACVTVISRSLTTAPPFPLDPPPHPPHPPLLSLPTPHHLTKPHPNNSKPSRTSSAQAVPKPASAAQRAPPPTCPSSTSSPPPTSHPYSAATPSSYPHSSLTSRLICLCPRALKRWKGLCIPRNFVHLWRVSIRR